VGSFEPELFTITLLRADRVGAVDARGLRVRSNLVDGRSMHEPFADIHCHILPGIDDGAKNWDESLAMARMAADDGTETIVATPHQLGSWSHNLGDDYRPLVDELNERLVDAEIPITVLVGGEIRIEPGLIDQLVTGELVTLGDHRRHVLLELPHELYFPIDGLMEELASRQIGVVLAHPERNEGLLRQPDLAVDLVESGCLMQLTAGSLCGTMGPLFQDFAEWMIAEGLVHIVATDGHSPRTRRPLMGRAFERVCELASIGTAEDLCSRNPARIAAGRSVTVGRREADRRRRKSWWNWRKSA
jgi:protein-tyrosine phosphatase